VFALGFYSASDKHLLLFLLSYDLFSFLLFLQAVAVFCQPFLCFCGTSCYIIISSSSSSITLIFYLQTCHLILPVFSPEANIFLSTLSFSMFLETLFHKLLKSKFLPFTQQLSSHQVLIKWHYNLSLGCHSGLWKKKQLLILSSLLSPPFFRSSAALNSYHLVFLSSDSAEKKSLALLLRCHRIQDIRYDKNKTRKRKILR